MRRLAGEFVILSTLLLFLAGTSSHGLKCYLCNNCMKYELSQTASCKTLDTRCMKVIMLTGQVQRRCANEEICSDPETHLRTSHQEVTCCAGDNCNSSIQFQLSALLTTTAILFLLLNDL